MLMGVPLPDLGAPSRPGARPCILSKNNQAPWQTDTADRR